MLTKMFLFESCFINADNGGPFETLQSATFGGGPLGIHHGLPFADTERRSVSANGFYRPVYAIKLFVSVMKNSPHWPTIRFSQEC